MIMLVDRALLEGMAPGTLLSWRSHRVKRVVTVLLQQKPEVCLKRSPRVTGCVPSEARQRWG